MMKRTFVAALLGCMVWLALAESAEAQSFRSRRGGVQIDTPWFSYGQSGRSYYVDAPGFSYSRGYYPYYGRYGYGSYYDPYGGYYYSGRPMYSPGYYTSPSYGYGSYSSGYPSYPGYDTDVRRAGYYGTNGDQAMVRVAVPAPDAKVWFSDTLTRQRGVERVFHTPGLERDKTFSYMVKASWMENGQEITREKEVAVRAGQETFVDFGERRSAESPRDRDAVQPRDRDPSSPEKRELPPE